MRIRTAIADRHPPRKDPSLLPELVVGDGAGAGLGLVLVGPVVVLGFWSEVLMNSPVFSL